MSSEEYRRTAQERYYRAMQQQQGGNQQHRRPPMLADAQTRRGDTSASQHFQSSAPSSHRTTVSDSSQRLSDEALAYRLQREEIENAQRGSGENVLRSIDSTHVNNVSEDDVHFVSSSSTTSSEHDRIRREREDANLARRLQLEEESRARVIQSPPYPQIPTRSIYQEPDPRMPMPMRDRQGNVTPFGLGMDENTRRMMQGMIEQNYSVDDVPMDRMRVSTITRQIPGPLPPRFMFGGGLPTAPQGYVQQTIFNGGDIHPGLRTVWQGVDDPLANMSYEDLLDLQERIGNVPRGVDKDTIENSSVSQKIESKEQVPKDDCPICISSFEEGEEFRRLPCLHVFHRGCIDEWLESNDTCPICKRSIREGEVG